MIKATGAQVEVVGQENIPDEPVLFVSNHQGAADIPLLLGYLDTPLAFVAKWELKYAPLLSTWMKQLKCIFIKRSNLRQTLKALKDAGRVFAAGQSLVVFPEGTRSQSPNLQDFRRGSFKIALREEVPIVPVAIKDSYQVWEGNDHLIQSADVKLIVSEPIYPGELTAEEEKNIKSKVKAIIARKLEKES
jgi:1-acyl-sn-glycerol-3-phosphate acyltransferase